MNNTTIPDTGNISVTINDATVVVPWQSGSTAQGIATQLQSQLQQAGGGFLQVTRSGSTLSLSSSIASADANWPILYSITDTSSQTPSFTLSDTGMSGGTNPTVVAPTTSPGATLLYSYSIPAFNPTNKAASGYLANGNLQNVTDSVMGSWSYQYDDLNRLTQANASAYPQTGFAPYGAAQLNWGYDSFGDYKGTTLSGTTGFSMPQVAYSYNGSSLQNGTALTNVANNRIDGYNYDASGDLLSDPLGGQNYYVYDAEGRVSTVGSSVKYVYDAEGRRVAKESVSGGSATVTNLYVLGLGGEQVSELNGSGSWVHSNVYAGGKLLATYNPTGLHFHFTDWLGTNRIQTSGTGMLEESCMSLPFGDMLNCSGSDSTEQHFTGKERDSESGLDYFGARYYASNMGRFMSPDWSAKQEPVPYSKLDNPQTLNLYNYMRNNPLGGTDPDGHCGEDGGQQCSKNLTQTQVTNIVYNETQSLSGSQASDARRDVAHAIINGDNAKGDARPATASDKVSTANQQTQTYKDTAADVKCSCAEAAKGVDPTNGSQNFNLRPTDSTKPFQGADIQTQSGPLNNSYPTPGLPKTGIYVNTYLAPADAPKPPAPAPAPAPTPPPPKPPQQH